MNRGRFEKGQHSRQRKDNERCSTPRKKGRGHVCWATRKVTVLNKPMKRTRL